MMNLRSHSSREGNVSQNLDLQAGGSSEVDNLTAMEKALLNPLIFNHILAQLDTTELKRIRLVCRNWAEVGGSLLGKRTVLHVSKLLSYDGSKVFQAANVTDLLMRRVVITNNFDPFVPNKKKGNVIAKIFTDLGQVSQLTREVHFNVNVIKLANGFVNGMRMLKKSTCIQHISIQVGGTMPGQGSEVYPAYSKKLPPQTNLTSIEFELHRDVLGAMFEVQRFQPLLQVLIDAAPNLTCLNVRSSLYPNLEGCKNLKVLKFALMKSAPNTFPTFDLVGAIEMLAQVKDSLIELNLSIVFIGDDLPEPSQNIAVPVMSKLASLYIHPAFLIQNFYDEDHLPVLKNLFLTVNTRAEAMVAESHLDLWKRHRGVQSLRLDLDGQYLLETNTLGGQIVRLFPSVKKFDLTAWFVWFHTTDFDQEVNQRMRPFLNWDLEESSVHAISVDMPSVLVSVLDNVALWKGAKSVHFSHARIKTYDLFASMKDLILLTRGFKSVKISGEFWHPVRHDPMASQILTIIKKMFEESGAPIRITGGVDPNY